MEDLVERIGIVLMDDIDGVLVGGASLKVDSFKTLITNAL